MRFSLAFLGLVAMPLAASAACGGTDASDLFPDAGATGVTDAAPTGIDGAPGDDAAVPDDGSPPGSDASGGNDGGTDAATDAAPPGDAQPPNDAAPPIDSGPSNDAGGVTGLVLVGSSANEGLAAATFGAPDPGTCTRTTDGVCTIDTCASATGGRFPGITNATNAGAIALSGGNVPQGTTIAVDTHGGYLVESMKQPGGFWAGGETISLTAPGGPVPGFTVTDLAPRPSTLSKPQLDNNGSTLSVQRNNPLDIAWTNGDGELLVTLEAHDAASDVRLQCTYATALGRARIATGTLAKLPAGGTGTATIDNVRTKPFTAGAGAVNATLVLATTALAATLDVQ